MGWGKWVRNQPRSHVQGWFSSVSFLKPAALWLSGQDQALLHLTLVAVDLGNCNLQDRFLPNHPWKPPWGIKNTPNAAARGMHSPLCKPLHSSEGSAAPILPWARRTRELRVRGCWCEDKDRHRRYRGVGAARVSRYAAVAAEACLIAAPQQR